MKHLLTTLAGALIAVGCEPGGEGPQPEKERAPETTPLPPAPKAGPAEPEIQPPPAKPLPDKVKDPVCDRAVDRATAKKTTHEGVEYFFCSDECLGEFGKNPRSFLPKP